MEVRGSLCSRVHSAYCSCYSPRTLLGLCPPWIMDMVKDQPLPQPQCLLQNPELSHQPKSRIILASRTWTCTHMSCASICHFALLRESFLNPSRPFACAWNPCQPMGEALWHSILRDTKVVYSPCINDNQVGSTGLV